jgi:ribonuclease HII
MPLADFYRDKETIECGCDEAGAGCLAGPVVTAAVIWPPGLDDDLTLMINDSKKLSQKKREMLAEHIKEHAISYHIEEVSAKEIDKINIRNARIVGFHRAISKLMLEPELIVVDGDAFSPYRDKSKRLVEHVFVKGGDTLYRSVAAASILAKVHRDELICNLHQKYPLYGWITNKGYGTAEHMKAIQEHGITKLHRKSYAPCQ